MSTEFWRGRKIPTGSGSGLNADLLDGHVTSYFEPADATILKQADVDDTPVDGVTTAPVSSNWAYDHAAATQAHGISSFGSTLVDDTDASTARSTLGLGSAATHASSDFETADATILKAANVSSTPTSGATTTPISSDAAFALLMKLNLLLGGI